MDTDSALCEMHRNGWSPGLGPKTSRNPTLVSGPPHPLAATPLKAHSETKFRSFPFYFEIQSNRSARMRAERVSVSVSGRHDSVETRLIPRRHLEAEVVSAALAGRRGPSDPVVGPSHHPRHPQELQPGPRPLREVGLGGARAGGAEIVGGEELVRRRPGQSPLRLTNLSAG